MELLERWTGVVLGLVLLGVVLRGALAEAARGPRRDAPPPDDVTARPPVDARLVLLTVLVLATLGPRLVSLLV